MDQENNEKPSPKVTILVTPTLYTMATVVFKSYIINCTIALIFYHITIDFINDTWQYVSVALKAMHFITKPL